MLTHQNVVNWSEINAKQLKGTAFNGIISKHHIVYSKDVISGEIVIKFGNEIGKELVIVDYKRRGSQLTPQNITDMLRTSVCKQPQVDQNEKDDLKKLCEYLPPDCQAFYLSL